MFVVDREAIDFILLNFHGTHVMNVADWQAAYCLFPYLTIEKRKMLFFSAKTEWDLQVFEKYADRGYEALDYDGWGDQIDELRGIRRIGDVFCRRLCFRQVQRKDVSVEAEALAEGYVPFKSRFLLSEVKFKFETDGSNNVRRYVGRVE